MIIIVFRLFNTFEVIDAVVDGNAAGAIEKLRVMFAADRSAEYTFVGAFAYHFRRMFGAKALMEQGVNSFQVAKQMRIWGNRDGFFAQLRKLSLAQIGSYIARLARTDYEIKSGLAQPRPPRQA